MRVPGDAIMEQPRPADIVALDSAGNVAAATSTGGMTGKRWGRVGDSPVIGAGTYASNAGCAVSATGHGEYFIRAVVAHDICAQMQYAKRPLAEAASGTLARMKALGGNARDLKVVAYKGSSEAITNLLGGHIDLVTTAGGNAAGHVAAGRMRVVGAAAPQRFGDALADVPTWKELGVNLVWVPEDKRTLYHAGLAHGANHLVTLVVQAMELLRDAGASDPAATLRPLLTAALDNALTMGDAALTGPIVRGDIETVRAHLVDIIRTRPDTLPAYVALARATANTAVLDGRLLPIRAAKLVGILNDALEKVAA